MHNSAGQPNKESRRAERLVHIMCIVSTGVQESRRNQNLYWTERIVWFIQWCIDLYVWSVVQRYKCANSDNTYSLFNNSFLSFSRWLIPSLVLFVSIRLSPAENVPFRLWTLVYNQKPLNSSWSPLSQTLTLIE